MFWGKLRIEDGVVLGNISSIFDVILYNANLSYMEVLGHAVMVLYAVSTGVFVGCIAVALAEILHTFPILFKRFNLNKGLKIVIFSMAIAKCDKKQVFYQIMCQNLPNKSLFDYICHSFCTIILITKHIKL